MVKINNPFVIVGYKGERYFCDRKNETAKIVEALHNERNVTLVAPRRMGKTGLIHHVFEQVKRAENDVKCFYIDIYPTMSLVELSKLMASGIIGNLDSPSEAIWHKIQSFFGAFRPAISYDPLTGMPQLMLDVKPENEQLSLQQIFEYIAQSGRRCYIALDEFQQIMEYGNANVEALLRSFIQRVPNVSFIFAGSRQHILQQMFALANRPFFHSAQMLSLGPIDQREYFAFAAGYFAKRNQELAPAEFDAIYTEMRGITWHINVVLNRLYAKPVQNITSNLVSDTIDEIVDEQHDFYQGLYHSLTYNEATLLRALARERTVKSPLSVAFSNRYNLPATSSISTALRKLERLQLIEHELDSGFRVYDPLLARWLLRLRW